MLQIMILRRKFEMVQLFQLVIGFFFGWFLDLNMDLTSMVVCESVWSKIMAQLIGCTVLGIGIAFEIKCGSVTMPGEGITVAVAKVSGMPFPKAKIIIDTTLVVIAVILGYVFFSGWLWQVTGPGTLFAMIYVGMVVKAANAHIGWFDRVLHYVPGFRRYIYGLARFVNR